MMLWMVKIIHKKLQTIFVEPVEAYEKVFSTKAKAEEWLLRKGFVYGRFKYFVDDGESYWFHQSDKKWDLVEVDLRQMEVDSDEKSWVDDLIYRI